MIWKLWKEKKIGQSFVANILSVSVNCELPKKTYFHELLYTRSANILKKQKNNSISRITRKFTKLKKILDVFDLIYISLNEAATSVSC